jgi:hypothetical protein
MATFAARHAGDRLGAARSTRRRAGVATAPDEPQLDVREFVAGLSPSSSGRAKNHRLAEPQVILEPAARSSRARA